MRNDPTGKCPKCGRRQGWDGHAYAPCAGTTFIGDNGYGDDVVAVTSHYVHHLGAPVLTATDVRNHLAFWSQVDLNGEWSQMRVEESFPVGANGPSVLAVIRGADEDDDVDYFDSVGTADNGAALYAIAGWMWTRLPDGAWTTA